MKERGKRGAHVGKGERGRDAKTSFAAEMAASHSSLLMERGERSWGLAARSYTLARCDGKKSAFIQGPSLISFTHWKTET